MIQFSDAVQRPMGAWELRSYACASAQKYLESRGYDLVAAWNESTRHDWMIHAMRVCWFRNHDELVALTHALTDLFGQERRDEAGLRADAFYAMEVIMSVIARNYLSWTERESAESGIEFRSACLKLDAILVSLIREHIHPFAEVADAVQS